jgi:hypothetical protein
MFANQRQQEDATLQRRSDKVARIMMRRYIDGERAGWLSTHINPPTFPAASKSCTIMYLHSKSLLAGWMGGVFPLSLSVARGLWW